MTEEVADAVLSSARPAPKRLTLDVQQLRERFLDGFDDRRRIVYWLLDASTRTLGELPPWFFGRMADAFRGVPLPGRQQTLMAVLLAEDSPQRVRLVDELQAERIRDRIWIEVLFPAYHRAFRKIRRDAGEYFNDSYGATHHDPALQKHIAMRPALEELASQQQATVQRWLEGFDDVLDLADWAEDLEMASHGEAPDGFVRRCRREPSVLAILLGDRPAHVFAREVFAVAAIIRYCNAGTRDLSGYAQEVVDADRPETEVPTL